MTKTGGDVVVRDTDGCRHAVEMGHDEPETCQTIRSLSGSVTIARFKPIIGNRLRSHRDEGWCTGIVVAWIQLNRMFDLARPIHVRVP